MPETFAQRLQRTANRLLHPLGLHLIRARQSFGMGELLARAAARRFSPGTIIDVGASDGVWSLGARRHFPDARFLLFEALDEQRTALDKLHRTLGFEIVNAVAGASPGTTRFSVDPDLDGSPYLLKLDTHGYELPVLAGAAKTLAHTHLLIIESYNFKLTENCLRFHELCAWLETRGFRCCDLADPMHRPSDGVLWQLDLAFAPHDSPLFATDSYR